MSARQDPVARIVDRLFTPFCRAVGALADWAASFRGLEPRWPPLFVVGAPRSGTTAVYLHIVNQYRVAYLPNVANRFPGCPLIASRLARFVAPPFQPTYDNRYGIVEGTLAPGDGWEIFHRWFPRYRHEVGVNPAGRWELPLLIARFERWMEAPFVNKNNNHCTRIPELSEWCPDARFVHVRRDLVATAASLLEGRRAHAVEPDEPWGVRPPKLVNANFDSELELVVATILEARNLVTAAFQELSQDRRVEVEYMRFCRDPSGLEAWLDDIHCCGSRAYNRREVAPEADLSPSERSVSDEFRRKVLEIASRWRSQGDG